MSTKPINQNSLQALLRGFEIQIRVVGALMMRELHTRYGRENIGYLWLIGEPLMLATVISSIHVGGHAPFGSDIKPLPFTVVGYTTFIMFRGIVNRSEGAMEANAPLLYHRMVTALDVTIARALIEACGTVLAYVILIILLSMTGLGALPVRPLYIYAGLGLMFWWSFVHSMIVTGISHDNRTIGRFVHPYTYFSIPFSGAFYQVEWIPQPYRSYLLWYPMPHILEIVRYGQFQSANLKYVDFGYVIFVCGIMTALGLICLRLMRSRIHLN
jgi:capsular polysaccharide transport system permease protein